MSAPVPYGVAVASELGAVSALRQLAMSPNSTAAALARIYIAGFYKRQTSVYGEATAGASYRGEKVMSELEQAALQDGSGCFAEQFISVRKQVGLQESSVFSGPHRTYLTTPLQTPDDIFQALSAATDARDGKPLLRRYVKEAATRSRRLVEISQDLDQLESRLQEAQIDRFDTACVQVRAELNLPASLRLSAKTQLGRKAVVSVSQGIAAQGLAPEDTAAFLARRAVDGFVESEGAVLRALGGPRAKREPGWAEMLLHGFCEYNKRNKKNVQARLAALEKEMRNRGITQFASEIYETRFLLELSPSLTFPYVPPPPTSAIAPSERDAASRDPVVRQSIGDEHADLPAYERVDPRG